MLWQLLGELLEIEGLFYVYTFDILAVEVGVGVTGFPSATVLLRFNRLLLRLLHVILLLLAFLTAQLLLFVYLVGNR